MVTEGSVYLYEALDKKVYFKEATILVPSHWSSKDFPKARTESFEKVLSMLAFNLVKYEFAVTSFTYDVADTISISNTGQNKN